MAHPPRRAPAMTRTHDGRRLQWRTHKGQPAHRGRDTHKGQPTHRGRDTHRGQDTHRGRGAGAERDTWMETPGWRHLDGDTRKGCLYIGLPRATTTCRDAPCGRL